MIDKKLKYKNIKGQKHMLAYITPGEAKQLEKLGGQKTMTKEGIPAYPPDNDARGQSTGKSSTSNTSSNSGNDNRDTYRMSPSFNTRTTPAPKTTTPTFTGPQDLGLSSRTDYKAPPAITYIGGNEYPVVPENRDERERQDLKQSLLTGPVVTGNSFMDTVKKFNPIGLGLGAINPYLGLAYKGFNYLKDKTGIMNNQDFFDKNVIGNYGYGENDYDKYMSDRMSGLTNAYGRTLNEGEVGYGGGGGGGSSNTDSTPGNTPDDTTDDTTDDTEETIEDIVLRFQGKDRTLNPAAAGVANTDELRAMILERAKNLYT